MKKTSMNIIALIATIIILISFTGCTVSETTITPNISITPTAANLPTPTSTPTNVPTTPTPSPTPFTGTIDQEFRYRIDLLDTTDGMNVQIALKDLDETAKGQSDQMKDLLTANFLVWFKKASFYARETYINRYGDINFNEPCTDEKIAELNEMLKGSALKAFPSTGHEYIYVHPAIYMIPELAPNAMTEDSKLFFTKYEELDEQSYLLWRRDGPPPELDLIFGSLRYWEIYCESIDDTGEIWSFPAVEGLPAPWGPEGMLRMLRMKLIANEDNYMFRSLDNRLSETYRYFFRKYIEYYPDSETAAILTEYLAALEDGEWLRNDASDAVLKKYGLEFNNGLHNSDNPLYLVDID